MMLCAGFNLVIVKHPSYCGSNVLRAGKTTALLQRVEEEASAGRKGDDQPPTDYHNRYDGSSTDILFKRYVSLELHEGD
ncbi:hypothetical protein GOP47_0024970 [Adiantum capillus-veneris]|uniref:Uncharacterized protein n=1 Tax=Adiantum capillus-veneris TaxID=13818 RepID=A0A9D4Z447_ADICA|nr:hypothetical protein GOP47_0024970 [Adiantum capillus-veneris]